MKKRKNITVLFVIVLIILIISSIYYFASYKFHNLENIAINKENGEISNSYFNINANGTNPELTTKGINEAIQYAKDNNITDLKLEKGTYEIIRL